MSASFQAPRGTRDVLPPETDRWISFLTLFHEHARAAGYGLVMNPIFEEVGVFHRLGAGSDVVTKEMYEFRDRSDRTLALRPEGTASVARAFVQHRPPAPWKVFYAAPQFRYEAPQAGRYRQHHQVGAEVLGSGDPDVDVEVIALAWSVLRRLGLDRVLLVVNSMGDSESRAGYLSALEGYLSSRLEDLDPEDQPKAAVHPMRVLDSKREATKAVALEAPSIQDHLTTDSRRHFERVQEGLGALDIPFALDKRLVRGFDYYTHTTFEFQSSALDAAQSTVCGGGRYDGLVEELGGPATPGIGFGMGIERVLLAADAERVFPVPDRSVSVWVVDVAGGDAARDLTHELRAAGISADRSFDHRSMRSQMKAADRSGAVLALIVGEQEREDGTVTVRDLRRDDEQIVVTRDDAIAHVGERLPPPGEQQEEPVRPPYHWLGGQE
jgi:histidyl-tRNA synthetase